MTTMKKVNDKTSKVNDKISKDATSEALLQHDYAMDDTNAGPDKRSNKELDESPVNTPSKNSHVRKWVRPNEDSFFESIMSAIQTLGARFDKQENTLDKQEKMLEDINFQIKENSIMICNLSKALEFNAAEVQECKSKVSKLEEKVTKLEKENATLRERAGDQERYSRRWNLRIKGMKEKMNENTREEVIVLLQKIAPTWAQKMDEMVDTVHRVGKREEKRTRQVIIQFVMRQHRDGIWRLTKESEVCKEAGIRFAEDLTAADKQAREALWPQIQEARRAGKKAYFRGPIGFINGQRI